MFAWSGPLCAFAASGSWAVGVTTYARLASAAPPWAINLTRALIALAVFAPLLLVSEGGFAGAAAALLAVGPRRTLFLAASMVTSYALGDLLFLLASRRLGTPGALAIASTYPIVSALAGVFTRGERLPLSGWLGLLAVVAGTVLVIAANAAGEALVGAPRRHGSVVIGVLLALVTAVFWAGNVVTVSEGSRGVGVIPASVIRMLAGALLCPMVGTVMARLLRRSTRPLVVPWPVLRPALWAFALETGAGTFFYTYGLSHSPLAVGAALSSLAPVLAIPVALVMRTERFSARKSAGIVLVVAGVVLLLRR